MPRIIVCKTCQVKTQTGAICRVTEITICAGRAPLDGCGITLSAEERHVLGTCCANCEQDWHARIRRWRQDGDDATLDQLFDRALPTHH